MAKEITTIKIQKKTKQRLEKLKENKSETYEDLIKKVLWLLNTCKINPESTQEELKRIDKIRKIRFPKKTEKEE
jgi:tRNA A37 methylthiotransferase MiaB